ncbi:MAG: phytoene/squalene synthase family protein [Candidatus Paceibacterota bacterium]
MDKYTKSVESITKKFGTSYYFATRFLPNDLRQATYALYSFFRIPDEIVDNSSHKREEDILGELKEWEEMWIQAYSGDMTIYPVLNLTAKVFKQYGIPYQYSLDFLKAMEQDVYTNRYADYLDLQKYMYGSASVVGLMMSYVVGFNNDKALEFAPYLGEAMQLTNFIRDIGEDYKDRGRIYIPQEDMSKYNVKEMDIKENQITDDFIKLIQFEIKRARSLYRQSDKGIKYLNKRGRFAVIMASRMYEAILDKIEHNNYNVLIKRARTSKREKIYILGKSALEHGFQG